jgi:formylglycine-generating enzyme required for sulfatase activity
MRFSFVVNVPTIAMAAVITALAVPPSGCQQAAPVVKAPRQEINLLGDLEMRSTTTVYTAATGPAANGIVVNTLGMRMIAVQPTTFAMGSPMNEAGRQDDEARHEVRLTRVYHIASTEVTQSQWQKVMRTAPWRGQKGAIDGKDQPATHLTHAEAVQFCVLLSRMENANYRLPTEAEWENACRAGNDGPYHSDGHPGEFAWTDANTTQNNAAPVAKKKPNALGLYDMHGNVAEWCADWYGNYPRTGAAQSDPAGPAEGEFRVVRGGGWDSSLRFCRSAYRTGMDPQSRSGAVGLRVVLIK